MADGLAEALVGPVRAFSASVQDIDPDTLDRLHSSGKATDLAAALASVLDEAADPRLLSAIVLITDGRHNLGPDPVRLASEHGTPIHVLGVTSETSPDDVQVLGLEIDDQPFAGKPIRLLARLRSWGFQDSTVTLRLEEGEQILSQVEIPLAVDGQVQPVALSTPPMSPGPHLLQLYVVPRAGELTPHNNQSLLALNVRQSRLRILLLADRPNPESGFVRRTLMADSTLQVDAFIGRGEAAYYGGAPIPTAFGGYDAVVVLSPEGPLDTLPEALQAYLTDGGGTLIQTLASDTGASSETWSDILPTVTETGTADVHDQAPLHLVPETRNHPIHRGMTRNVSEDPWQRLPPLQARTPRVRVKPTAKVLLAAADGAPVVVAGAYGTGRVVHVTGTGFWRQSLFGEGAGGDARTVPAFWRSAVHWLALAESGGRVQASAEQPVYRSGQPAAVTAQVFDELQEPLTDAEVELSLSPGGRSIILEPTVPGHYRTELPDLAAGTYTFLVRARIGMESIGQTEGSFVIEDHTIESDDLRSDPEMLAAIARASGGTYRGIEAWPDLVQTIRPTPILVREQQDIGVKIHHMGWLLLLTGLLTTEWILRKRSGML
ncbi:MAG: VWA domain-containing protein [bacterium]|nr:VWA domain-containing protein [bacterium]